MVKVAVNIVTFNSAGDITRRAWKASAARRSATFAFTFSTTLPQMARSKS